MNLIGVVTITDGQINYWPKRNDAIDRLEDFIKTREFCFNEDLSRYKPIVEQLLMGCLVCTDREYDPFTMTKANLALRIGAFF